MQLQIWFVNSNAQNAFATSVIGMVYGPVFPACLSLANDLLPSEVRLVSMGIMYVSDHFYFITTHFQRASPFSSLGASTGAG